MGDQREILQPCLPFSEGLDATLAAWRRYGIAAGHSDRTIDGRASTVRLLASSGADPLTTTREDLTEWLSRLRDRRTGLPAKSSTRATYRSQLVAFFTWLQDTGRRDDDPTSRLPRPRARQGIPRPVTSAQLEAILRACAHPSASQTRAYVILAAYAGLRVHEVAKVRGEDVTGDDLYILGKGGIGASLPMHPLVSEIADAMPSRGWWFPSTTEIGHVHRCSVSSAIKRAMDRAGVSGTPHCLRHFYGTEALRASGGNLRTAQRALRHASVATTAIYTQVSDDALRQAISGIPA